MTIPPSTPTDPSAASAAILIVDDSRANRLAFEAVLEPLGYPVLHAGSGPEAMRHLLERPVALMLLDVEMPTMSGFQLAALVRAHPRLTALPIIFVTAISRDSSHVFTGYAHGAVDYILKPFDSDILRAKVSVFLELHRRQQTIREQAEQLHAHQLRELERRNAERFRSLTDSLPLPVWGVRPDGSIAVCNRAWTEYSGLDAATTRSILTASIVHPSDGERLVREWRERTQRGEPFDVECRLRSQSGTYRWHLLRAVPERGSRDDEPLWIVAGVDNDAQKMAEEQRARMLAREQRAREEAETANQLKDDFLATVSHELRTPLSAILGWTQLIQRGTLDAARLAHAVRTIERSARAQAQLVEDILDVSRIVNGKLRLDARALDLAKVLFDAVETMRPAATARKIELLWSGPESTVNASGDPARIAQIALNLLSNAVKFTPEGGRIEVSLERDARHAAFRVRDSGSGIAAEFLPFVFDRFRQGESALTRTHGGLGLGLSIVKTLAELHGGSVEARSDGPGRGAEFVVVLPVRATEAPDDIAGPALDRKHRDESAPLRLAGATILLVEDHAEAREILQELLAGYGARVRCAGTTADALRAVAAAVPDLVVSDIGLPDEDGYTLLRRLRTGGGAAAEVPAIAVTAFARPDDRQRARDAGFQAYLSKPVEPDELLAAIARLLTSSKREARGVARRPSTSPPPA